VELIDSMGDDLRVANVARVSFANWKQALDVKDVRLLHYLAEHDHSSPFRHTAITIRVKAPIWLARQLGKHQVGMSWNEVSRRYVDTGIEFWRPTDWRRRPDASIKQGSGEVLPDVIQGIADAALEKAHEAALDAYDELLALGVAPEQARGVLPQNMMTTWIWTGSLAAFFHCYRLRSGPGAQEEAVEFASLLESTIRPLFPHSWKALDDAIKTH
jgi:thymidylate synthase (FAD)